MINLYDVPLKEDYNRPSLQGALQQNKSRRGEALRQNNPGVVPRLVRGIQEFIQPGLLRLRLAMTMACWITLFMACNDDIF